MTDNQIIEVVAAHAAGEKIQFRNDRLDWTDCANNGPAWNFEQCEYRVKPKAREWSVHVIKDGMITSFPAHSGDIVETIRVREIIE